MLSAVLLASIPAQAAQSQFTNAGGTVVIDANNNLRLAASTLSSPAGTVALACPLSSIPPSYPRYALERPCAGDCNHDGVVTVDEVLTMDVIALGNTSVSTCDAGDANHDGQISIDEILTAINNALNGCAPTPTPTPTRQCSNYACGGACIISAPCTPGTVCPALVQRGQCELSAAGSCDCVPVSGATPTPTPTPSIGLPHGHTCCQCPTQAPACEDFAWVEVERACPIGCTLFADAECEAPCHPGPQGGPAQCIALTPCATDQDCDDGNPCTADRCTIDGCTHQCVCV